jgi:signal transduction histidine kinase
LAEIGREAVRESGLPIQAEVSPELSVRAHRHELVGLLVNLLTNARDVATSPGQVRLRARRAPDGWTEVEVVDDGPGIPTEIGDRIFEPFFTTKEVGSGTGLGLYMAYTYAQNAGGQLSYRSMPEKGTRFLLRLPPEEQGPGKGKEIPNSPGHEDLAAR